MRYRCLALVIAVLTVMPAQAADEQAATIEYLQSLQTSTGGFLSMQPQPNIRLAPTLRATSGGVRGLKYWGGKVPNVEGAKAFVMSCYDAESGGFSDRPGTEPELFITAVGMMAVGELKLPLEVYQKKSVAYLVKNVKTFEDMRIAVAGLEALGEPSELIDAETRKAWLKLIPPLKEGDAFIHEARLLGGATAARYRLDEPFANREIELKVLESLAADQRADGGFGYPDKKGSDLETTYRVMRTFARLEGVPKDVPALTKYLAQHRCENGGYASAPGEIPSVGPTYYVGIIRYWLSDPKKR